jgi:circadian clock protein KaiB
MTTDNIATKSAQVIAVPTLIKELPFPPKRFIGDMSNTERIVVGSNLEHGNVLN